MDLHLMEAAPTAEERSAVDELLGPPEIGREGGHQRTGRDLRVVRGGHEAGERRHLLLPALHALQARAGWISRGGLNYVCQRLSVPPAEAYGVATFYAMFSVEERPRSVVHVCDDLACRGQGGLGLCEELGRDVGPEGVDAGGWTWHRSPCLGMCEQAPAVFAQRAGRSEVALGGADRATVDAIVAPDFSVTCSVGL
ncbi:MAG TPA: NAD(P)H-dependent oxidoreductase subunit E, partial [Actinomycetota bacterium]|nr:NAD(P)H-dependent oxidoreductase subunit E [Actinomycetota bacterium]